MYSFNQEKLELHIDNKSYQEAESILHEAIVMNPKEHWFYTKLSSVLFEQKKYTEALAASEKAYKLEKNDALVLWDYACVLDVLDKTQMAIKIWQKILTMGVDTIAYGPYGEGKRWAKSILNDTHFRLSLSYYQIGLFDQSLFHIEHAISRRCKGIPSIYPIQELKKQRKKLVAMNGQVRVANNHISE